MMTISTISARRERLEKIATPGLWAMATSRGRWTMANHLAHLDRQVVKTLRTPDSRLIVTFPPRHGKSLYLSQYVPAWFLGVWPDRRVILTSYQDRFAATWGRKARELVDEHGQDSFGIRVSGDSAAMDRWDLADRLGGMQTAGRGSSITGKGANLLIADDLIKDYEEAHSETVRSGAWDWWTSTAYTRLEPGAAVIVVGTRWHEDDIIGRILAHQEQSGESWNVVNYPALAEANDPLGRPEGAPLWPQRYPRERLEVIKRTLGSYQWNALYQQRPAPPEGGMFQRCWFQVIVPSEIPTELHAKGRAIRYWDHAATPGAGDYSVGVLIVRFEGKYYVLDVVRGQWSVHERKRRQLATAQRDAALYKNYRVWAEQEPGSAGKEGAQQFVREFSAYGAATDRVTGDKQTRALDWSAELEAGNVRILSAPWTRHYIQEHAGFPHGGHDDQVDASSGAFSKARTARTFVLA